MDEVLDSVLCMVNEELWSVDAYVVDRPHVYSSGGFKEVSDGNSFILTDTSGHSITTQGTRLGIIDVEVLSSKSPFHSQLPPDPPNISPRPRQPLIHDAIGISRFEPAVQINQLFCALEISVAVSDLIARGVRGVGYCKFPCCCCTGRGVLERDLLVHGDEV